MHRHLDSNDWNDKFIATLSLREKPQMERTMGSTGDKVKGVANDAIGNAKQGIGKAVGSEKLEAEGKSQEIKGDAQKAMGTAKDRVKDTANSVADKADKAL